MDKKTRKALLDYQSGNNPSIHDLQMEIAMEEYDLQYEEQQYAILSECLRLEREEFSTDCENDEWN